MTRTVGTENLIDKIVPVLVRKQRQLHIIYRKDTVWVSLDLFNLLLTMVLISGNDTQLAY